MITSLKGLFLWILQNSKLLKLIKVELEYILFMSVVGTEILRESTVLFMDGIFSGISKKPEIQQLYIIVGKKSICNFLYVRYKFI